tara:strand:+ start:73 stop:3288 length:3216 start_codon:yes stop_codon:yes gene_type:complete
MSQPTKKTFKLKKQRTIMFRGKEYKYRTAKGLANELKITETQAKNYIKDVKDKNTTRYLQNKKGEIEKYNLKDKPLVFKKFDVKKIYNKSLLKGSIKDVKILTGGYKGNVKATITIKANVSFSPPNFEQKTIKSVETFNPNKVSDTFLKSIVKDHFSNDGIDVQIQSFDITSTLTDKKFSIVNQQLRDANPIDITNIYNEVIPNKDGRCIQDYMNKIYKKFSSKEIEKLKTTNDIHAYCVKHDIKMIAYGINGNIIKSHYPAKHNKTRKNMIYIHYNNHLYPLKNTILNKKNDNDTKQQIHIENIKDKLIEFLNMGILPAKITTSGSDDILSFIVDDIQYFNNKDYDICKDILTKFGLADKMHVAVSLSNIGTMIAELYTKGFPSIKSFIPHDCSFKKSAVNYNSDEQQEIETRDNIYTIDKNGAYSFSLAELPYLISVDMKTAQRSTRKIHHAHIVPHFLYIVDIPYSSNLLDNKGVYDGGHLIYCRKEGLDFNILEEIETKKHENYYRRFVKDVYEKVEKKHAKKIINIFIGKLERNRGLYEVAEFNKVCNNDEADTFTGFKLPLNHNYTICSTPKPCFEVFNYIPIAHQIKDYCKRVLYQKMKSLKLNGNDIIQIKTDSITFKSNNFNKNSRWINKNLDGWKIEGYKKIAPSDPIKNYCSFELPSYYDDNELYQQYAGGGKTYNIVHDVIPKIKDDYIILSPSHISIGEYRRHKFNCDVIQTYTLANKVPSENIIIIDEYGMLDNPAWLLIYKCMLLGKTIKCWGDNQQLLPVNQQQSFDNKNWLNYCFNKIDTSWINRRNNFSQKQYDKIINCTCMNTLLNLVKKFATKNPEDADVIIVHLNQTRHFYNAYMLKLKGICELDYKIVGSSRSMLTFYSKIKGLNELLNVDTKLICLTNELRKKQVFNKYCFKVKEITDKEVILYDEVFDRDITFKHEEIRKNFDYAYARTIYNIQGQTLNSYYWGGNDKDNYFLDGRMAYTIISRLREEVIIKEEEPVEEEAEPPFEEEILEEELPPVKIELFEDSGYNIGYIVNCLAMVDINQLYAEGKITEEGLRTIKTRRSQLYD